MLRKLMLVLAVSTMLISSSLAMNSPLNPILPAPDMQTITLNTGFNHATQKVFTIGQPDIYWGVIADPISPQTSEPRPADTIQKHNAWQPPLGPPPPNQESQWISYTPGGSNLIKQGAYYYQKCFCLKKALWNNEAAIAQSSLDVAVRADDAFYLGLNVPWKDLGPPANKHQLATSNTAGGFSGPPAVWKVTGKDLLKLLRPGRNCLTVRVDDLGGVITGFNLKGSLTATGIDGIAVATSTSLQFDKCSSCQGAKSDMTTDAQSFVPRAAKEGAANQP